MATFVVYSVNPFTIYGGMEKALSIFGRLLQENGHQFRIVSLISDNKEPKPVVDWLLAFPVFRYPIPRIPWPKPFHWLFRVITKGSVFKA